MLSFQLPVRPDEVHSSGWKLVFNYNQCTVPEITTILQDISLYIPISWLFQMSSHWLHWKVKSSLWALPVFNPGGVYHKTHLVTFLYIFLLVDCFNWALIDCIEKWRVHSELCQFQSVGVYCKTHLVTFLYIFLLVDCFKWALIDCIEKWRVHSELCQFQMGGFICLWYLHVISRVKLILLLLHRALLFL